ncbi:hypothetical protein S7335_1368 [Synechococcus sp. PCC 7335]|nr:hypothetical protein S7335_1368 [Synechococcus sp. PCC 7335]
MVDAIAHHFRPNKIYENRQESEEQSCLSIFSIVLEDIVRKGRGLL